MFSQPIGGGQYDMDVEVKKTRMRGPEGDSYNSAPVDEQVTSHIHYPPLEPALAPVSCCTRVPPQYQCILIKFKAEHKIWTFLFFISI